MVTDLEWTTDLELALKMAGSEGKAVLLEFFKEDCAGCRKMDALVFSDPDVRQELMSWFIPLRVHILKNREIRSRYSAYWTPSFYFLDYRGKMIQSFNGYLGAKDFRVLMRLGKAAIDLPRGKYIEVIDRMDDGLEKFPHHPKAPAMLFTRGMAEFLLGKEKSAFRDAMTEIVEQYPDSYEARMWPWMDRP